MAFALISTSRESSFYFISLSDSPLNYESKDQGNVKEPVSATQRPEPDSKIKIMMAAA